VPYRDLTVSDVLAAARCLVMLRHTTPGLLNVYNAASGVRYRGAMK
jgi:hypothetical protein